MRAQSGGSRLGRPGTVSVPPGHTGTLGCAPPPPRQLLLQRGPRSVYSEEREDAAERTSPISLRF